LLAELAHLRRNSRAPAGIGSDSILRCPAQVEMPLRAARFIPPNAPVHLIDVGANDGQWAASFLASFPNSTAELWEPLPPLAEALRVRFRENQRVKVIAAAASSQSGTATIIQPAHDAMASLHKYSDFIATGAIHGTAKTIDVQTRQLDDVQRDLETRCVVLKVDAQGHELEVLAGAIQTLNAVTLAIVEASLGEMFDGRPPTFAAVCCSLARHGLLPCMFPSAGTMFGIHPVEQDIMFVRRTDLFKLHTD